jgi:hypothetical protein
MAKRPRDESPVAPSFTADSAFSDLSISNHFAA